MVAAVLADFRAAPISEKDRALFAYLERVNHASYDLKREETEAVKRAGWSDEAIYDAVTVCALFNFYNRWCDGTGVQDMPVRGYEMSGKRIAALGYAPAEEG